MRARQYGYAYNVASLDEGKPEALKSLDTYIRKHSMANVDPKPGEPSRLPPLPDGVAIDETQVQWFPYKHGGQHLQAVYEFDYPEAS